MELLLGSHVLEHGNRVGRLAGFELEPADLRIRRIIFSPDGDLGPRAMTRPLAAIDRVTGGRLELRREAPVDPLPAVPDVLLLSRATRFVNRAGERGRLTGVEVSPADRRLLSVSGRTHWWSRRSTIPAAEVDCSTPGEVRAKRSGDTRAA